MSIACAICSRWECTASGTVRSSAAIRSTISSDEARSMPAVRGFLRSVTRGSRMRWLTALKLAALRSAGFDALPGHEIYRAIGHQMDAFRAGVRASRPRRRAQRRDASWELRVVRELPQLSEP